MRPVSTPTPQAAGPAASAGGRPGADWSERAGRLYTELEAPARAMVRRAYGRGFSDDEVDDIYSGAWVGTLRALGRRHAEMTDEEIGRYLLAAVANHASKELRRRRRKPTAPLELVDAVPDDSDGPAERAVGAERSRITRDLLASLPPRRRAVMYLRYGWGLEPSQVRELIDGLSPRAYRKEITRGIDELTDRMRRFERGEWCDEREPLLKAYASGLADAEERRQAQAHLSHCTECADFVSRLSGHLHDLGAAISLPVAFDAIDGGVSLDDRLGDLGERARDAAGGVLARGGEAGADPAGQVLAAGGSRGAGATLGAGLLAKLGGLGGTAGKIAVACLGGGAAATACVSAGVIPAVVSEGGADRVRSASPDPRHRAADSRNRLPIDAQVPRPEPKQEAPAPPSREAQPPEPEPEPEPEPPPAPAPDPVAPSTPPVEEEFGVAAAAGGGGGGGSTAGSGSGGGGGSGGAVRREFMP
ncbi:MAG TPA: hypothetical protein VK919_06470 [Solirubrobacterales bacterium]|nr:hypothetical protein [Solirubrobacterales bacterium]